MSTSGEANVAAVSRTEAGIVELILQRLASANALNQEMVDGIVRALDESASAGGGSRPMVIRSLHRAFCAGFDLGSINEQSEGDVVLRFVRLEAMLQRLRRGLPPTIAVVEGAAYGAGADLAVACTWRVGTAKAKFRFPGFRFGVALGTRHLARVVGSTRARHILLENRLVEADEALAIGLLTHLVAPEAVDATVSGLASSSCDLPTGAAGRILSMTAADTDDADMADLVRSLAEPGLHERIAAYVKGRET